MHFTKARSAAMILLTFVLGAGCSHGSSPATPDGGSPDVPLAAPETPPAQICGNTALLSGPASAPAGAVTVGTQDDLSALVDDAPPGTTFWLTPGTHVLPTGAYSNVIPKDGDVFVGAPGAILDGQHSNQYAFTQHAKGVTIRYLTIRNFGTAGGNNNEGVVNHDAADGWVLEYSTVQGNAGAGVFLGSNDVVRYSCLQDNGQYGFSAYSPDGVTNVTLDHNEIVGNNVDDWESREPGCGCTGGGKFWATAGARITSNYVHDNKSVGIWADTNNVGFDVEGNYIADNDSVGFLYEVSYNARVRYNTFVRNARVDGPANPGFPTGAIYLSESGGDVRAGGALSTLEIDHNVFTDNWSGVILWENADRFCNSPANTSSGDCTLGGAATLSTCADGTIASEPYYSDCRWKTQNVSVHDNLFSLDPAKVGGGCDSANGCGLQGLFSNDGTYPSWSPYQGAVIEDAITFHQNNVFSSNRYVGPWHFMVYDQATLLDASGWQAAPYGQDRGSTFQ